MDNHIENSYFASKKISLIILAVTAFICSRMVFFFISDPEGPNLLIVVVLSLVIYFLSLTAYLFGPFKITGSKRLLAAIVIQVLLVTGLYFCMK